MLKYLSVWYKQTKKLYVNIFEFFDKYIYMLKHNDEIKIL